MPASMHLRVLSVRLPEPELRRFKSLAADRGLSIQEALHEALEAWSAQVPKAQRDDLDILEGSLADIDVQRLIRGEKEAELAKERFLP